MLIDNTTKRARLQKWCVALRSGEYGQCTGAYHKHNDGSVYNHCCLGVAERVLKIPRIRELPLEDTDGDDYQELEKYLSLTTDDTQTLINLNDSKRFTFPEIADYIEQNLMPKED